MIIFIRIFKNAKSESFDKFDKRLNKDYIALIKQNKKFD